MIIEMNIFALDKGRKQRNNQSSNNRQYHKPIPSHIWLTSVVLQSKIESPNVRTFYLHCTYYSCSCKNGSELLGILWTIRITKQWIATILIILISLIWFLIQLIESLTSTRKVPRVLCTQMCKLWRMNIKLMIRMTIRCHMIRYNIHWCHFMFLFPFHSTILKPNLDLSFG